MSHLLHSTFAPKTSPTLRRPQTRVAHDPTRSLQIQANIREIFMAALSSTMTEGKIISWIKSEGEKLSKGEGVVVVESDKADMDVESFYDSYLSAIMVEEGNAVPVGSPAPTPSPTPTPAVESSISTVENVVPKTSVANNVIGSSIHPASEGGKRVVASPDAKKLAKELGVDLMGLMGSGPNGRIVAKDVEAAALKTTTTGGGSEVAKPSSVGAGVELGSVVPFTTMHSAANRNMLESPSSGGAGVELGSVVPFTTMQSAMSRSMLESLTVPTFRVGYTITTDALYALYKKTFERELGISSSSTSEKLEAFSRKLSVDEDETRAKTPFIFLLSFSCCSWLIPVQSLQAIEDVRTNVVYEVGELFELGIQLSYLLLLLALLGVGTFFVIRQVLMRRELDLSAKELQEQVRSGDASATELFELGAVMLRRKFYPAATKYLLQAIDKWDGDDQDLAQVYNALGVSYILGGKVDTGIAQFENAVKLQPGYVTAWNNLGDAYEKNNDMTSALKAFEEVLLFDPNNKVARPRRDALKEKVKMYKGVPVRSKKK